MFSIDRIVLGTGDYGSQELENARTWKLAGVCTVRAREQDDDYEA
jgi:hypothetical protein